MSRTKSGQLIKQAARPRSDAGTAGFRAWRDLPPAVPVEPKPGLEADIEAGRVLDLGAVVRMRAAERAAESARQRPPNPIEYPPIDPGSPRETAAIVRELESFGAVAAPVESSEPKRRMTQPGLFDSLGVKV